MYIIKKRQSYYRIYKVLLLQMQKNVCKNISSGRFLKVLKTN